VERFNGRISEVVQQTRFKSSAELEATLTAYCKTYNHHIPQRSLDHNSPVQALQARQVSKPHLIKRLYRVMRSRLKLAGSTLSPEAALSGQNAAAQRGGSVQRRVIMLEWRPAKQNAQPLSRLGAGLG
jgi:hypothetical protein